MTLMAILKPGCAQINEVDSDFEDDLELNQENIHEDVHEQSTEKLQNIPYLPHCSVVEK